jgi:flagellar basal body-associated protein FliL
MIERPAILNAVEKLGYRVTAGDVSVQSGLQIEVAQQGLLALASDAGGHLQVSETGEIVYLFPASVRTILLNKFWRLRVTQTLGKVWQVCFYLIRISFGIILVASILLMVVAIVAIIFISINAQQKDEDEKSGDGLDVFWRSNSFFNVWNFWYVFDFSDDRRGYRSKLKQHKKGKSSKKNKYRDSDQSESNLNFLEAIFSFLFGDGNPNVDLEERRWQGIGSIIRNQDGAIVAEQLAPYLDLSSNPLDSEDYMLPVLIRFNGYPEVSSEGNIVYYFPELQVMAKEAEDQNVPPYLKESLWHFSQAGGGQLVLVIGLGCFNLGLAVVLGILLQGDIGAELGGYLGFVQSIYWVLLIYAVGFLGIPAVRFWVLKARNLQVKSRNQQREDQAKILSDPTPELTRKLKYARQFAAKKVITDKDITYSTEEDLLDQEVARADQIDRDWEKRL